MGLFVSVTLWGLFAGGSSKAQDLRDVRGITLAPIEDRRLGNVGYGSERCEQALVEIADLGANWISLTPFGRMDDVDSSDVVPDFEIPLTENEEKIRRAASQAHARGLKVALIPHIYVMSGKWRGKIDPGEHDRLEQWFLSYEAFLTRWAVLAENIQADLFSIGVEFKSTTNCWEDRWRKTIDRIRGLYSGAITYSANWDEVAYVPFWDALDLIGINAFWPLATNPGDRFEQMCNQAVGIAKMLEGLSVIWDKPILFTEFGVKSARDAALAPWEWPEHCADLIYDEQYQAEAYEAVFEAVAGEPWFAGLFIWKYFSDPYDETQEQPIGFSPRAKAAEAVLSKWFSTPWRDPNWFAELFTNH